MPTILSRFDTIFIVKDEHNQAKDMVRYSFARKGGEVTFAFYAQYLSILNQGLMQQSLVCFKGGIFS